MIETWPDEETLRTMRDRIKQLTDPEEVERLHDLHGIGIKDDLNISDPEERDIEQTKRILARRRNTKNYAR
jgi:hypothetical protein